MTRNVLRYYKRLIGPVVTATLAVLAAGGTAWGQNESFKMLASDGEASDGFAYSVAIDGDTGIMGAPLNDDAGSSSGSAYIFQQDSVDPRIWNEIKKLNADDAEPGDWFGVAVAISGDFAIVGAWLDDHSGLANAGSAYIFHRDAGGLDQWNQVAKLTASDPAATDVFGWAVAIDGNVVIIGARMDDDSSQTNVGSAYIFRYSNGSWIEEDKITASDGEAADQFGNAVSISGETAIIGAWLDNDNGTWSGSAYIFGFDGQDWVEEEKLTASDGASGDLFGRSVSISGGLAIVGAFDHDTPGGSNSGAAYIFSLVQGQWGETTELIASDAAAGDLFGFSVSISGETVIVGAPHNDDDGINSGSAYVFWADEPSDQNGWGEVAKLTSSDAAEEDRVGQAVAMSGRTGIIGVRDDDDSGTNSGSAYVFDPVCPCPWDLDGDGGVGVADLLDLLGNWGPCADCNDCPGDFDANCTVGESDLLALLANWGLCPCVEGTPPLSLDDELAYACLTPADWDDFVDKMQNGTEAEKDNYLCWMEHYLYDCNKCICTHIAPCPGPDPFSD